MTQPFDETREDLGYGLTRRRPKPGEVDPGLRGSIWIYECVLSMSSMVDVSVLSFENAQQYIRDTFASAIREAADQMQCGDATPPS